MDNFRTSPISGFGQKPRAFDVDRRGFLRIALRIIDLEHSAVDNQIRFGVGNAALDRRPIGNIEIAVLQGYYLSAVLQSAS